MNLGGLNFTAYRRALKSPMVAARAGLRAHGLGTLEGVVARGKWRKSRGGQAFSVSDGFDVGRADALVAPESRGANHPELRRA